MNRPCLIQHVVEPRPPKEQPNGCLEGEAKAHMTPTQRASQGVGPLRGRCDVRGCPGLCHSPPRMQRKNSKGGSLCFSTSDLGGEVHPPLLLNGSVRARGHLCLAVWERVHCAGVCARACVCACACACACPHLRVAVIAHC